MIVIARKLVAFAFWSIFAAYVGLAGWFKADLEQAVQEERTDTGALLYDGIEFASERDMRIFVSQDRASRAFPWIVDLPGIAGLLFTAAGAAVVGSLGGLLWKKVGTKTPLSSLDFEFVPAFAIFIGLFIVVVAVTIPSVLVGSVESPKPEIVVGLSFIGAFNPSHVGRWLQATVKSTFKTPEKVK